MRYANSNGADDDEAEDYQVEVQDRGLQLWPEDLGELVVKAKDQGMYEVETVTDVAKELEDGTVDQSPF